MVPQVVAESRLELPLALPLIPVFPPTLKLPTSSFRAPISIFKIASARDKVVVILLVLSTSSNIEPSINLEIIYSEVVQVVTCKAQWRSASTSIMRSGKFCRRSSFHGSWFGSLPANCTYRILPMLLANLLPNSILKCLPMGSCRRSRDASRLNLSLLDKTGREPNRRRPQTFRRCQI